MAGKLDSKPAEEPFAIQRFDRLQNELAVTGNFTTMQRMNTEFPRQTQILIEDVLELGSVVDEDSKDKLVNSLGDTAMLLLMADGENVFGDMKDLNKQFGDAIKLMRKELPLLPTPRIYSQYSGLNESIVVSDSLVGFSIDKYMGIDYPLYKKYFYDHQIVTMSPERIVTDCLFYYLKDNYPLPDDAAGTLLENMVLMGKLNWITCKLTHGNRLEDMLG
ncbi:MAG: gliding motility lipoprotein GldB, partial [Bacteroidaceae bacterium]|nr:gliding motility lipoprotein GldB [Bacteroidaceae bacterium]